MRKLLIIFILFLAVKSAWATSPSITGYSGIVSNGNTITVSGSSFGTKHTPAKYDYFDEYTSDWSCSLDTCDVIPATTGIAWDEYINAGVNSFGNEFANINKSHAYFSTGRGYVQWPEYLLSAVGYPNSSILYDHINTNEIYIVWYVKFDPSWPIPYQPVEDKELVFWKSTGSKCYAKVIGAMWWNVGAEGVALKNWTDQNTHGKQHLGPWQEIKVHLKMNTWTGGTPNQDAIVQMWVDNEQVLNITNGILDDTDSSQFSKIQIRSNFSGSTDDFGDAVNNLGMKSGEEFYNAYSTFLVNLNSTDPISGAYPGTAAIYLSNTSTWGTGPTDILNGDTTYVRQAVGGTANADLGFLSYSDTSLKFETNTAGLNLSLPVYLYITNWSGETNSVGYLLSSTLISPLPLRRQ